LSISRRERLRLNNPGWIVEIRQNNAEETLFMPVFGLDYANYRDIATINWSFDPV
jgi:hypothetical protein